MTEKISLIGRKTYKVNDKVTINIPTVRLARGENIEEENEFWSETSLFTVTPDDMVVELTDFGVDFTKIDEYELFVLRYSLQKDEKVKNNAKDLLFAGFNLWRLNVRTNGSGEYEFVNDDGEVIIDKAVYTRLSELLAFIMGHEKPKRNKFGTEQARLRWIEKERRKKQLAKEKAKRSKSNKGSGSLLDGIILRLVCNANFPYNFETVNDVTLFDLIYSLKQIEKDISVTDLMQSRFVGVDLKKYSDKQLSRYVL